MNNLLSKSLLCGVIATSFVLINCQKAPNRPVSSGVTPQAKPQAARLAECSANMITAITERSNLVKEIKDLIKSHEDKAKAANNAAGAGLSDGEKQELQNKIKALAEKSEQVYSLLRAGPQATPQSAPSAAAPAPGAGQFDGCTEKDAADPKKITEHKIEVMQDEDKLLATVAKQITGQGNDIADGTGYAEGKSVKITADLATLLSSNTNVNGAKMIVDGAIADGAGDAYKNMLADKTKTSCIVSQVDNAAVAADANATIATIGAPSRDASSQRMTVLVGLVVKGEQDRMMSLTCNIAENADASKELVKALGALMPIQAATAAPQAGTQGEEPQAGTQAEPQTAAPQTGDQAAPQAGAPQAGAEGEPQTAAPQTGATPPAEGADADAARALQLVDSKLSK